MLIKQLPDNWRNKNSAGSTADTTTRASSPTTDKRSTASGLAQLPSSSDLLPRTPLHLLGQAARAGKEPTAQEAEQDLESVRRSRFGGSRQSLPW
jgi:hypothetical protein